MLLRLPSVFVFSAMIGICICIDCSKNPDTDKDEYKLRHMLFCEKLYDPHVRPVARRQDKMLVNVSLDLKYVELVCIKKIECSVSLKIFFRMTTIIIFGCTVGLLP